MILTCVDGSSYDDSVCDHGAWLAGSTGGDLQVLHAIEPARDVAGPRASRAARVVRAAVDRVRENGAAHVEGEVRPGSFVELARESGAELIVMGKRGEGSEGESRLLGSNVEPAIRRTHAPLCLAPKLFLPISRALVLLDDDLSHRRAVEFVTSHQDLSRLEADVVVVSEDPARAEAKLDWARGALRGAEAKIFGLRAASLDDAVMRYMESRAADLIIISRAVLLPKAEAQLRQIEADSFWGWRTPVLVC